MSDLPPHPWDIVGNPINTLAGQPGWTYGRPMVGGPDPAIFELLGSTGRVEYYKAREGAGIGQDQAFLGALAARSQTSRADASLNPEAQEAIDDLLARSIAGEVSEQEMHAEVGRIVFINSGLDEDEWEFIPEGVPITLGYGDFAMTFDTHVLPKRMTKEADGRSDQSGGSLTPF